MSVVISIYFYKVKAEKTHLLRNKKYHCTADTSHKWVFSGQSLDIIFI